MLRSQVSGRIVCFVVLAALLAAINTYGLTLLTALFLTRAGPRALPIYYVISAVVSIPISLGFTALIDRWRRPVIFTALLAICGISTALAAPFTGGAALWLIYALFLLLSVFEQLSYSTLYVLMADYFTPAETHASTTPLAAGMAIGGCLGGVIAGLSAMALRLPWPLFGVPILLLVVSILFVMIRDRIVRLGESEPQTEESLWTSLASFAPLLTRYPIVSLLALGVFLNVLVQTVIGYQVLTVYADHFAEGRSLTVFLGIVNGALNLVNVLTSFLFTGPLLARIGVARMNVVYPAMTTAAAAALGAAASIPTAIFGHVVHDPWGHSVDAPVFASNYNAVPHRFVARVRIFNDGLIYPAATIVAGVGLWMIQDLISQRLISLIALVGAMALLLCGLAIRRAYAHGLMEMLRTGSLDLDAAEERLGRIPASYYAEIRGLLAGSDPRSQRLGLELAARADAREFLREIEDLLTRAAGPVRSAFVRRFAGSLSVDLAATIVSMLRAKEPAVRAAAAEALVASDYPFTEELLLELMADTAVDVAIVAAVEAYRRGVQIRAAEAVFGVLLSGADTLRMRAVQVIRRCVDAELLPLLSRLREGASPTVLAAILEAAAELGQHGAQITLPWARRALGAEHADGVLRRAAYRLLAACGDWDAMPLLANGLGEPLREVRGSAAAGLAGFGEDALPLIRQALSTGGDQEEIAAIDAAGRIGGPAVTDLLYRHLSERYFPAVRRNLAWLALLPPVPADGVDPWAPFAAALADSNKRALQCALAVLGALGYRRTLRMMRGILAGGDANSRTRALETITLIGHRRFVQPLMPMLEAGIAGETLRHSTATDTDRIPMIDAALADPNRWIRAGAVLAARRAPPQRDDEDVVEDAVASLDDPTQEPIMNRLLFLKSVALFEGLSLDDLLSVDAALGQEEFLAGEVIMRQGEAGATLFLLARGAASVRVGGETQSKEVAQLAPGDFFGEMSLFDDQPRSATVVALTDATLLTLERDRFSTLVQQRPDVLLQICKMFGSRLRETNRKLLAA